VTVRADADWRVTPHWRLEARAGVMLPATIRAYAQFSPDSGFRQRERYGFGGVLVEWHSDRVIEGWWRGTGGPSGARVHGRRNLRDRSAQRDAWGRGGRGTRRVAGATQ
jgi:hypothetical protein